MRTRSLLAVVALVPLAALPAVARSAPDDAVRIRTVPEKLFVEDDGVETTIFYHLVIENGGDAAVTIDALTERFVGDPGEERTLTAEQVAKVSRRGTATIEPGGRLVIFGRTHRVEGAGRVERLVIEAGGARFETPVHTYEQKNVFRLPFAGEWLVAVGHRPGEHHRTAADAQAFAWDIMALDEKGRGFRPRAGGGRPRAEDAVTFGLPLLAPAAGTVVRAKDGRRDVDPGPAQFQGGIPEGEDRDVILGNYVVIDHGHGEFSLLAHMRNGSIAVKVGDRVRDGQKVGECGNSGNTTQPHVHFQVMDGPDHIGSTGLPIRFSDYEERRGARTRHVRRGVPRSGAFVRRAPW